MPYEVSTPVFEGPFDLLLHLITSEQVDVYEISLSRIVDGYLAQLDRMEHLDLDVATEFLLIAATLVELKARRLLPGIEDLELDEELLRFEERDLLLARLLECKTFKDAARALEELVVELPQAGRTTFRSLTGHHRARLDVIVRFLAVLELYKRGMVELHQATTFGELEIGWVGPTEADAADLSTADLYD